MAIVDICLSSGTGFESAYLNQRKRQVLSTTAQQFYIVVVCNEEIAENASAEAAYEELKLSVDWTYYRWLSYANVTGHTSPQTQSTTVQSVGSPIFQNYADGYWYYGWAITAEWTNSNHDAINFGLEPLDGGKPTDITRENIFSYAKMEVTAESLDSVTASATSTAQATLEIDLVTSYELVDPNPNIAVPENAMHYVSSKVFNITIDQDSTRTDDIFVLNKESTLADGTPLLTSDLTGSYGSSYGWNTSDRVDYARVTEIFDSSALNVIPVGKTCNLVFTAYHVWNNYQHGVKIYWTGVCTTTQVCPAPLVTVEVIDFTVILHLSAPYNEGYQAQMITIHMAGGDIKGDMVVVEGTSDGRYYTFDDVVFDYPPLGTPLTFEVIGECTMTEEGENGEKVEETYTSELVSVPVSVSPGLDAPITRIESVDGALCLDLKFYNAGSDRGPSVSTQNDGEYHQLLGREYQSVYFGGFKQRSISFEGILIDDHGTNWENLSYAGICIVRFPDGRRYPVDANVQVTPNSHDLTTVSVSAEQVDWS